MQKSWANTPFFVFYLQVLRPSCNFMMRSACYNRTTSTLTFVLYFHACLHIYVCIHIANKISRNEGRFETFAQYCVFKLLRSCTLYRLKKCDCTFWRFSKLRVGSKENVIKAWHQTPPPSLEQSFPYIQSIMLNMLQKHGLSALVRPLECWQWIPLNYRVVQQW